jgi:TetR/AcrR family transcriptional repressor of nem operon
MSNLTPLATAIRSRGRPREFDVDAALDKAARVFSERGFHATSIADLTEAMQLASGSVYKAFKDKRAVFIAAFDRMQATRVAKLLRVVNADKSARNILHEVLFFYADSSCGVEGKRGCLLVSSATDLATFDPEIERRISAGFLHVEMLMARLIKKGQQDGSIPTTIDSGATARLMLCVVQGMRVIGKTGRTRAEMKQAADVAMKLLD